MPVIFMALPPLCAPYSTSSVRQAQAHRHWTVIRQAFLPFLARLAIGQHAQRIRLQPVASGVAQHDVVDERLAAPAWAGPTLGGARQWCGLAKRGPELILSIHMAVEVAHDGEGDAFRLTCANPLDQRRHLLAQLGARATRAPAQSLVEATGLQVHGEHAQRWF